MKDSFNFKQHVSRLAQCFEEGRYYETGPYLKNLMAMPEHPDVLPVVMSAFDYQVEKTGHDRALYQIQEVLTGTPEKQSPAAQQLQAMIVVKWSTILADYAARQPGDALSTLTRHCRGMAADHPLSELATSCWTKLVERTPPAGTYDQKQTYAINGIKNPAFRTAVLKAFLAHSTQSPDTKLDMLNDIVEGGDFLRFRDTDQDSARLILQNISTILMDRYTLYDAQKITNIARKVFVHGAGIEAKSAQVAAKCYMAAIREYETKPQLAFNGYRDLIQRKNPDIADATLDAAKEVLDMTDAGQLDTGGGSITDVIRFVADHIFYPAADKDHALSPLFESASNTLFSVLRREIQKPDSNYIYYNVALMMLKTLPAEDPRAPELVSLWRKGLEGDLQKTDTRYYINQMGAMVDIAAAKGNHALQTEAEKNWRAGVETMMSKNPRSTCDYIREQTVRPEQSPVLQALAQRLLPELEARAGIVHLPDEMESADFLSRYRKKKPGPAL